MPMDYYNLYIIRLPTKNLIKSIMTIIYKAIISPGLNNKHHDGTEGLVQLVYLISAFAFVT